MHKIFCQTAVFLNFSPITIPEATCIGYERVTRCMVPLMKCMDDEQKKKLDIIFKKDFELLNLLLSKNGFPTCEVFGKTTFKSSEWYIELLGVSMNFDHNTEHKDPVLKLVSRPNLNQDDYFLPTQSPAQGVKPRVRTLNRRNKQRNHKTYSKILI